MTHPSTPILGNPICQCGNRHSVRVIDGEFVCRLCYLDRLLTPTEEVPR